MTKLTSIKTFRLPGIPGLKTDEYIKDGFGGEIAKRHVSIIVRSVMKYCNNDLKEASRIMGWSEEQIKADLTEQENRLKSRGLI